MNITSIPPSPLTQPQVLPLRHISAIATERVLVVAPHPDDETLGCGGAIALLTAHGCSVHILVVSDGTQSHPNSRQYPASILQQVRAAETQCAMARLGVTSDRITFMELPDGAVPAITTTLLARGSTNDFSAAVDRVRCDLTAINPQTIFLPWRTDPHPDHRATWQIVQAALAQTTLAPRSIEYPIWDWDPNQRGSSHSAAMSAWRLDISEVVDRKQQAIAAYRSQTTGLIADDPTGFRLTPEMLANFTHPWEIYLEQH
jgi:LmbE family N-acetylglucosaminyl deacetylase